MNRMAQFASAAHRVELKFRQCIAVAIAVGSIGLGVSLMLIPATLENVTAFDVTVEWAAPALWGLTCAALGVILLAACFTSVRAITWPASGLAVWYGAVSVSIIIGVGTQLPVPVVIWMYLTTGVISGLLALSAAAPTLRR